MPVKDPRSATHVNLGFELPTIHAFDEAIVQGSLGIVCRNNN